MKLTPKQKAFVDHYLICLNATEAARLAGYSLKTARQAGTENLAKPAIKQIIDAKAKEIAKESEFTLERLDKELVWMYDKTKNSKGERTIATKCLEMLGRRRAAFVDKLQVDVPNYVDLLVEAQAGINAKRKQSQDSSNPNRGLGAKSGKVH